jgi:hypothetical protein
VNAAFLLVTTAWMTGQPAAAPVHAGPGPAVQACGSSCCQDSCNEGFCQRLKDRLRGAFQRDNCCDTCAAPKCAPAPRCERAPACKPACCTTTCSTSCGRERLWHRRDRGCCDTKPACPTQTCCDNGCNEGLLSRLRGLCQRRNNYCDCCSNGGAVTVPAGERIPAGKKMPSAEPPASKTEVRIITPAPAPTAAPALDATPAIVPGIDALDNRNPF